MGRVIADITVSLDGFVTGPNPGPSNGLGDGGDDLHRWAFSDDPDDQRLLSEGAARSGAVVLGRNLFDIIDGPAGWNDEIGYGAAEAAKPAFVVVTSAPPASVRLASLDWTFVTTGLVDSLVLHLAPLILGAGTPLFTDTPRRSLRQREVLVTSTATHLTYDFE